MTSWQNAELMICQNDNMTSWPSAKLTKCPCATITVELFCFKAFWPKSSVLSFCTEKNMFLATKLPSFEMLEQLYFSIFAIFCCFCFLKYETFAYWNRVFYKLLLLSLMSNIQQCWKIRFRHSPHASTFPGFKLMHFV
jgi:hypothetical protein